jgi:hypothetical protein
MRLMVIFRFHPAVGMPCLTILFFPDPELSPNPAADLLEAEQSMDVGVPAIHYLVYNN